MWVAVFTIDFHVADQPVEGVIQVKSIASDHVGEGGGVSILAVWTLWRREMVRFFRQRNRVIGAMATPLVFWLLLGFGLDRAFVVSPAPGGAAVSDTSGVIGEPGGPGAGETSILPGGCVLPEQNVGYLEYFYPGTVVLILLFTAIFSTISVIEDRREGFLQGVLVAPVSRLSIVLGKVFGGASIATIQGVTFLLIWPIVGTWPGVGAMIGSVAVMFILAVCLTGISLCLAWPMDSVAGFHAVMNLLLMPMWFLSGAVFPLSSAPIGMRALMWLNPLTYGQAAFATLLRGQDVGISAPLPLGVALAVLILLTSGVIFLAARIVVQPRKDGLV